MNKSVIVIKNCHICQVRFLPRVVGKPLPGEVVCGGDTAYFEFVSGHNVVINDDNEPCFGPGRPSFLQVGDEVVTQVEERGQRGHYVVTAWTHSRDWRAALDELSNLKLPKPAPALPKPVLEVAAQAEVVPVPSVFAPQVRNTTGRDRRIFRLTVKPATQTSEPASPAETCLNAVTRLEGLPPAETTIECSTSTSPATTDTEAKTAEPVAKH